MRSDSIKIEIERTTTPRRDNTIDHLNAKMGESRPDNLKPNSLQQQRKRFEQLTTKRSMQADNALRGKNLHQKRKQRAMEKS